MIKRFPLQFSEAEHRALKVAAAQAGESLNHYLRVALAEKIARSANVETAPALPPLPAASAAHSERSVLAEADEKAA